MIRAKGCSAIRSLVTMPRTTDPDAFGVPSYTRALELTNYAEWGKFEMSYSRKIPEIRKTNQVLIRNLASSINKHDYEMRVGYLQNYHDWCRRDSRMPAEGFELPLVLGRDFAGVVMDVGKDVRLFKPGDEVFGSVSILGQGCFSDFVVVEQQRARLKPQSLSFVEAASLPYVAGAVLSMCNDPKVPEQYYKNMKGKRVLIHGAGGGVGSFAVQLLKSAGAHVTTTSISRSFKLLEGLGADVQYSFRAKEFLCDLETAEKFELVLDVAGESQDLLMPRVAKQGSYVTFKQRLLENIIEFDPDLLFAMMKDVWVTRLKCYWKYRCYYNYFSYQEPYPYYLDDLVDLVEDETIVPVVQDVVCLEDVPNTMKRIEKEEAQGKTVVDMLLEPATIPRLQPSHTEQQELTDGGSSTSSSAS